MSESVRRVYQITVLVLLAFLATGILAKASPVEDGTEPVHLISAPELDARPQVVTRADGSVVVVWGQSKQEPDDDSVLYAAQSPRWRPTPITSFPPSIRRRYAIAVKAEKKVHITYSQVTTDTQKIWHHVLGEEAPKDPWQVPYHAQSTFAVDAAGCLHYVWIQDEALHYMNNVQTMTMTTGIGFSGTISDMALDVDEDGTPHLAWRKRGTTEDPSQIYYTPLVTDTTPVPIAQGTGSPKLAVEASGTTHLCWRNDDRLCYANSQDWSKIELIDDHLTTADTYSLLAGPGQEAHLLWTAGETLWYAHSVDWNASRRQIASPMTTGEFETTVDDGGSPHLAWAASEDDTGEDIFYQRAISTQPKIAVRYPQGGEFLTRDTRVKAEISGDTEEILRVEFYLQVDSPFNDTSSQHADYTLRELGTDRKGQDGWTVPLTIADLGAVERYRIMALATDVQGQTIRAVGGWFRTQPPEDTCTTLRLPTTEPVRGQSYIEALTHCQRPSYRRLHLYLIPASAETRIPLPKTFHYVGAYAYPGQRATAPPLPWRLPYDSCRFPDGRYVAMAIAEDKAGRRTYLWPTDPFVIDNAMAPNLEITRPRAGAVVTGNELHVSATADDVDGSIERVNFYLEQRHPLPTQDHDKNASPLEQRHLLWLGQGTDGTDGWNLRVPIDPSWPGEHCRIWATTFDDRGLQKSTYSQPFSLLGRQEPHIRILDPSSAHPLRDTVTIRASIRGGTARVREPQVYLQNRGGTLTLLGSLETRENYFVHEWDTREFPDGPYRLLVTAQSEEGGPFSASSEEFVVDNGPPPYHFAEPTSEQEISGTIRVALESATDPASLDKASLYYRDETGELYPIAEEHDIQTRWETTWNTRTTLDGTYHLVALLTDVEEKVRRLEQKVTVCNTTPRVAFASLSTENEWQGSQLIRWQTHHPLGTPLSTSLEYSADGGNSWSEIASDIQAENSYRWNTTSVHDSRQGRLRVSVSDGLRHSRATSEIFVLNNANEAPEITLLTPKPGTIDRGETQIAWQARDPDTDPLTVTLAYRRGEDAWTSIASNLTNTQNYLWDTSQLPAHDDYILRVTARDSQGATATDVVEDLDLVDNTAPSIRLLWPNTKTHLEDKTTILWSATDADEDSLIIDIYYSDNAGQSWIPLAEGVPNTGFYGWQVSYLPSGAQYRIKVVARDRYSQASDESDDVFIIGRNLRPRITLLSPTAAQTISGVQPIRWTAFDPEGASLQISVTARHAEVERWESLGTSSLDDGLLLWDTRDLSDGEYDLRAVATNGQYSASARLTQPVSVSNEASRAPHVRLVSPQGGEIWSGMREVLWEAWDGDGEPLTATLSTRAMGEDDWDHLGTIDGRTGHYVWDTRQMSQNDEHMLRIVVQNPTRSARDTTSSPVHLTNRDNYPPHIQILPPDATNLPQSNIIAWTANDPDGDPLTVDLSIKDRDDGPWQELATRLYDGGEYVLDSPLHNEKSYQIRAVASDAIYSSEDISHPFTTSVSSNQLPDLTLDMPTNKNVWSGTEEIRWQATDPSSQDLIVQIELSRDGGETWDILEKRLEDTGSYMWDTTAHANGPCRLRLTADNGYLETTKISHPFTLSNPGNTPPAVSLLSPRGGEIWSGIQEIRWLAQDKDGDELEIDLAYKIGRDDTWHTIARAVPNTGHYVWDTTSVPNCTCIKMRITANDGTSLDQDKSDTPFTVNNPHAPLIKLVAPQGGEKWAGKQKISWVMAQETRMTRVTVQLSTDAGQRWETVASDLPPTGAYLWDTTTLPDGSKVWVRVIADEYPQKAIDTSPEPVTVRNAAPDPPLPFYSK